MQETIGYNFFQVEYLQKNQGAFTLSSFNSKLYQTAEFLSIISEYKRTVSILKPP